MSHLDPDTIALIAIGESALPSDIEHVRGCLPCQGELDELTAVASSARAVNSEDRPVDAPAQIWDRIEAELAADSRTIPAPVTPQVHRKSRAMFALAASVGILIGGLGTYTVVASNSANPSPTLVAQAALEPLRGVTEPAVASVQQIDGREVLYVQASGLPATDGFYEVWLLAPDSLDMISIGMLDASEGGKFPLPAGIYLAAFPVVDISLERFDGDVTHSTDSILRGTLTI
ncbi:MAG: anti-sigma factor [Candidatus Nanopelagicales bacterium]|nr:anti-sigma factor [Candidatus Nanopelagicales bacterium]